MKKLLSIIGMIVVCVAVPFFILGDIIDNIKNRRENK